MRDHRAELFSVEIPLPMDTPQPVRRIERGSGREAYFGIALDFTDDIDAGRYRAALTPAEAPELYAALSAALSPASDAVGSSGADLQDSGEGCTDQVSGGAGCGARGERDDHRPDRGREPFSLLLGKVSGVDGDESDGLVRRGTHGLEVDVVTAKELLEIANDLAEVLEPVVLSNRHRVEDLLALIKGLLNGLDLKRRQAQGSGR